MSDNLTVGTNCTRRMTDKEVIQDLAQDILDLKAAQVFKDFEIDQLKKDKEGIVIDIMAKICDAVGFPAEKEDAFNLIYDDLYEIVKSVLTDN